MFNVPRYPDAAIINLPARQSADNDNIRHIEYLSAFASVGLDLALIQLQLLSSTSSMQQTVIA
jgi:hypothetical protein